MASIRTVVAALLCAAACGNDGGKGNGDAPVDAPPGIDAPGFPPAPYCTPKSGTTLKLTPVATQLRKPLGVVAPVGDPRLFVLEQEGTIRIVKDGVLLPTPFLDLTAKVQSTGLEQGLLGMAFHPDFAQNGKFYVFYTHGATGDVRVSQFKTAPDADVAGTAEKVILEDARPAGYGNCNGGTLAFGPDRKLYISVGDGGGNNNFTGSGQDPNTVHAKILRIDVDGGDPYAIPDDNPWAHGGGVPEMFAWGLRNPWRMAIDPATGDVYIGDVGEAWYEEIDYVPAGQRGLDFGWAVLEGPDCFTLDPAGNAGCSDTSMLTAPLWADDRRAGHPGENDGAIVAGGVYHGACMPDLAGRFFFGDYRAGKVRSLKVAGGAATDVRDHTDDLDPGGTLLFSGGMASFGVDGYGELYVTAIQSGRVYRIEIE